MSVPQKLLDSLKGVKGFDIGAFEQVHNSTIQITSIRVNPAKSFDLNIKQNRLPTPDYRLSPIPWTQYGYYLDQRPSFTFDPLFHAGCYYVQEASSMFLEQALKQTLDLSKSLKILDLSAAPGGKSTHIHSLISKDSILVSNEVIRSRAIVLKENIIKWGCENVVVTNNDPKDFRRLENYFDAIIVDAPCSGSGLFRRDPAAIDEWSIDAVELCSQRQQRILFDCLPALKKDGVLIYSTCSYSKQEDEEIAEWLESSLPIAYCPLQIEKNWGITDTGKGYRFWPDKIKGEGFFLACFRKNDGDEPGRIWLKNFPPRPGKKEIGTIGKWVKPGGKMFIMHANMVYAWPELHSEDFGFLLEKLRVVYSGLLLGELFGEKFVPNHALALSSSISDAIPVVELNYADAIRYLQRKTMVLEISRPGWQLVSYLGRHLGWINVLATRVNNYYPKGMRILKDN